jgi:hypothetical protein
MNRIRVGIEVVKTCVLAMAVLHGVVLVGLALRDSGPSWIHLPSVLDLQYLWPSLLEWRPGFLLFWLAFLALVGAIWWRQARRSH